MIQGVKNPKIIVDDYEYVINRKVAGKTMWRCSVYHKNRCKSRIMTYGKTVKITSEHTHPPSFPDKTKAFAQMVNIVRSVPMWNVS